MLDWLARLRAPRAAPDQEPRSGGLKRIAYSLFPPPDSSKKNRFVFDKYLLGVYFNTRMNALVYPEWQSVVYVDCRILEKYSGYFRALTESLGFNVVCVAWPGDRPLWELVLSRIAPIFDTTTSLLLCRDLDSITTYREAQAVREWIESGLACHAMTDNVWHIDPLMAGMCGFDAAQFRDIFPEYDSFECLVADFDLTRRGSDQKLLRERIWPKIRARAFAHCLRGASRTDVGAMKSAIRHHPLEGVRPELAESNLVVGFIGQAGVNEMELLRFFQRQDEHQKYYDFEDEHASICYWRR